MSRTFIPLLLVLSACGKDKNATADSGGLEIMVQGTIVPEGEDTSAFVSGVRAYGFDQGGAVLIYVSSNENATCESVTQYLMSGGSPYDPSDVLVGGACNLFISLSSGYEDGFSATDDPIIAAGTALECAMGEGNFELTQLLADTDSDYYWVGDNARWWQGYPTAYSYTFSGGNGEPFILDIDMSIYDGGFIHEEFTNTPASGSVTGTVTAEWCSSLGTTGLVFY